MERKRKLLVTASTFPRWAGDTEPRFVLDLCKYMTDMFDITVLVPAAPGAKEKEMLEGVRVFRYHYFPVHKWETLCYPGAIVPRIKEKKIRVLLVPCLLFSLFVRLKRILPEYDVVHSHWLIPQGIVQSYLGKPYLVTGHGGDVTSLNKGIMKKLKVRCLKKAKAVTVVSEHLQGKIRELVPDIESHIISMGVDTKKFGKQYFVPDYFRQGDKRVILFVGRLAEKKGVTYLLEAMKQIDALLVIVGDGPLKDSLQKQALLISDKVKFLGAKTHEELGVIYASADVIVIPSITAKDGDQEGIPTVIMEAMASGLPVVANDSGGIRQLIRHEENGLLCEEKNVEQLAANINRLLSDEELRERLLTNAENTVEQYSYDTIGRYYSELLMKAMNRRRI